MIIRKPIVAGKFYPAQENILKKQILSFVNDTSAAKEDAIACVMPHAGYIYSGKVASLTAASVQIKENILLLGPNHTGEGKAFSIISDGKWQTPLGDVEINSQIAQNLKKECPLIEENQDAHANEHSLEVQLPILQFFSKMEFKIVPLVLMSAGKTEYQEIAQAISKTIVDLNLKGKILIVASSDMTHYEPHEQAQRKDSLAIEAILSLDENSLIERIEKYQISMCGYVPVIITIMAAKKLGAREAKLIKYQTSAETSGDYDSVVGYAGIIIK